MNSQGIGFEELSSCLFNESNDAYFIVDPSTYLVTGVNPTARRLTGCSEADLVGQRIDQLIQGDAESGIPQLLDACRETTFIHARDGYRLTGRRGLLDVSVSQSRLHGSEMVWSLVVVRDITTQKSLERTLKQSKSELERAIHDLQEYQEELINHEKVRAIGELASGVAHDLNNLLVPAALYAELVLERSDLDDETREQVELIGRSVRESSAVISGLQQDMAGGSQEFESISVQGLIDDCRTLTRHRWESGANLNGGVVEFLVDIQEDIPDLYGNRTDIQRVLINLILNATQSISENGRIQISACEMPEHVQVTVTDDGAGMDREQQSRAMDLFYTTRSGGAGLGLNLSRRIIDQHGGSIDIQSRIGDGTSVTVLIPQALKESAAPAQGTNDSVSEGLSVLYIDDDSIVRKSVSAMLRSIGVVVESASGGRHGIEMFHSGSYDAVITDLGMNDINGWDVIRDVRGCRPPTSVCLISGWSQAEINRRCKSDCVPDFILTKPVTRNDLMAFLGTVCQEKAETEKQ